MAYRDSGTQLTTGVVNGPYLVRERGADVLPYGAFLIGNHADELTPWVPVLAASMPSCTGFVNIPCCAWLLEGQRYTPTQTTVSLEDMARQLGVTSDNLPAPEPPPAPPADLARTLQDRLAHTRWHWERTLSPADAQATHSKHHAYYAYVAGLHVTAGWCLETEALRIPSTKNWAFVGRCRWEAHLAAPEALCKHVQDQCTALLQYAAGLPPPVP